MTPVGFNSNVDYLVVQKGQRILDSPRRFVLSIEDLRDEIINDENNFFDNVESGELVGISRFKSNYYIRSLETEERTSNFFDQSFYDSLFFQIVLDEEQYVLSEGQWYRVDLDFNLEVTNFFDSYVDLNSTWIDADKNLTRYKNDNKDRNYFEEAYILELAKTLPNSVVFDLGASPDMRVQGEYEFCDLYDHENNEIIHLKVGKKSSMISHLLRQAGTNITLFKNENRYRNEVISKISEKLGIGKKGLKQKIGTSRIVLGILIKESEFNDIPFFSRVSFMALMKSELKMLNNEVAVRFITIK